MVTWDHFLEQAHKVEGFTSSRGKRYAVDSIVRNRMYIISLDGDRENRWELNLDKVYKAYTELDDFSTTALKKYLPVLQSMGRGLMLHLGMLE